MRLCEVPMDSNCTYDFAFLVSCDYSNPNGDPDFDNRPRTNYETEHGEITSECIKRKIRDRVVFLNEMNPRENCDIFIRGNKTLNEKMDDAAEALGLSKKKNDSDTDEKKTKAKNKNADKINEYMRNHYFDVRTFGAVLSTGNNPGGQVTGAIQLSEMTTPDPVQITTFKHTRKAKTVEKKEDEDNTGSVFSEKPVVVFGLYKGNGRYSAYYGKRNGVTDEDLKLFFKSLVAMFDNDMSACRTGLVVEKLVIFKHNDEESTGPMKKYGERLVTDSHYDGDYPQSMEDYNIYVNIENIPDDVEVFDVDLY